MATPAFASFRGHKGAINTLLSDDDRHEHVLISGSDDGSCRLWDVRTNRATKCINVKKALGLSASSAADADDASVNALAFGNGSDLHLAAGTSILTFDMRQEGLILDCAAKELFTDSSDEINSLAVQHASSPSKPAKLLAAADDNGDIFIYSLENHRLYKSLRGRHSNICMSAAFRPNSLWDLVSGGMDGCLLFWDFSRGRMKFSIDMQVGMGSLTTAKPSTSTQQLFNPPLVHAVAFAANGRSLAAALGDGAVAVVDFHSKQVVRRLKNHAAAVTQVHFPVFKRDEWLVTCGNDAKVSVFDYARAVSKETMAEAQDEDVCPFVVKDFAVQYKPNAMATSRHQNLVHVADLSTSIRSYPLL